MPKFVFLFIKCLSALAEGCACLLFRTPVLETYYRHPRCFSSGYFLARQALFESRTHLPVGRPVHCKLLHR